MTTMAHGTAVVSVTQAVVMEPSLSGAHHPEQFRSHAQATFADSLSVVCHRGRERLEDIVLQQQAHTQITSLDLDSINKYANCDRLSACARAGNDDLDLTAFIDPYLPRN